MPFCFGAGAVGVQDAAHPPQEHRQRHLGHLQPHCTLIKQITWSLHACTASVHAWKQNLLVGILTMCNIIARPAPAASTIHASLTVHMMNKGSPCLTAPTHAVKLPCQCQETQEALHGPGRQGVTCSRQPCGAEASAPRLHSTYSLRRHSCEKGRAACCFPPRVLRLPQRTLIHDGY